jgi:uncharacterized protein (UPF0332 family)
MTGWNILPPHDLLSTAITLTASNRRKPKQSDLKRAVSSIYYALFHALAKSCADCLIGTGKQDRANRAWQHVYRALEHGFAKNACQNREIIRFPQEVQDFANAFINMQAKRHDADYDPFSRVQKAEVLIDIKDADQIIESFERTSAKDKKAFAVWVLLKQRL